METQQDNHNQQETPVRKKRKTNPVMILLIFIIVILLGGIGALGYLFYQQTQKTDKLITELTSVNDEKTEVEEEYKDLLAEYETITTDNDSLQQELEKKKEEIKEVLEELKTTKNISRYKINQYKAELGTLRDIMKSYITQIDSLNTLNQNLIAENTEVKTNYKKVKEEKEGLEKKTEELSEKVDKGSTILVDKITVYPLNKKSKVKTKVDKIEKIKVCFTLRKNLIAEAGKKPVYIRIARPDNLVLASSESDLFNYQGEEIVFTSKRLVKYENKDVEMCIFWKKNQELIAGTYYIDIFLDGKNIGTSSFELEEGGGLFNW